MTFEQEVWDVICAAAIHAGHGTLASQVADVLAPRVAAAILAAASDGYWSGTQPYPPTGTTTRALSALRGETP